jgi:hypothetical protein
MKWLWPAFAHIALLLPSPIAAASPPAEIDSKFNILDYMIMDVCLDDQGAVIVGMSPADKACVSHRDIKEGDPIPYHLVGVGPATPCGQRVVLRDNVPWTHGDVTRVVGAVSIQKDSCDKESPLIPAYYSVRWTDSQYAFIMGTWSRGPDGGKISGGATPACADHPESSIRYFRNWVLSQTSSIANGDVGHAVFTKKGAFQGLARPGTPCPADYPARYLALWSRGDFTFSSGQRLNAIVSHPYSQANETGTSPGNGRQMERTYWTREFGQSRWENWKREDFVNKHVGKSAQELADDFFVNGVCSRPFEIAGNVTDGMNISPVEEHNGIYSQVVTDIKNGEHHRWIMVGCQDTTAAVPALSPKGDMYPSTAPVTPVFWDFWKQ